MKCTSKITWPTPAGSLAWAECDDVAGHSLDHVGDAHPVGATPLRVTWPQSSVPSSAAVEVTL